MGKLIYKPYKPNKQVKKLLLLEERYKVNKDRVRKYWYCKCMRCGNYKLIREDAIRNGQQTCGCLKKWKRHLWLERHKEN